MKTLVTGLIVGSIAVSGATVWVQSATLLAPEPVTVVQPAQTTIALPTTTTVTPATPITLLQSNDTVRDDEPVPQVTPSHDRITYDPGQIRLPITPSLAASGNYCTGWSKSSASTPKAR